MSKSNRRNLALSSVVALAAVVAVSAATPSKPNPETARFDTYVTAEGANYFALSLVPATTPAASTLATDGLSEAQEIVAPVRASPLAARAMAFNFSVPPTTIAVVTESIATVFTGAGLTITFKKPGFPAKRAKMVTSPGW